MLARELRTRLKELKGLLKIVRYIEAQIRYKASDVASILKAMKADGVTKDFKLIEGCSAVSGKEISRYIAQHASLTSLNAEDIKVAQSFFASLGKSDVAGETENCRLHEKLLLSQIDDAGRQISSKTRLYYTLGLFSGLMVSIIII